MIRLRILLILYRELYPFTVFTSLLIWVVSGSPILSSARFLSFAASFFWIRLICQALIWFLFRSTRRQSFVFFRHFGFSETELAVYTYLFDLIFFCIWIYLISQIL